MLSAVRYWQWPQWVLIIIVTVLVVAELMTRHQQRNHTLSVTHLQQIESSIVEIKNQTERLLQTQRLPEVKDQWKYVDAIASHYGVQLRLNGSKGAAGFYQGPLDAWNGSLEGPTGAVLVAARRIQSTAPTYLYHFSLNNGRMTLAFSVLGSN